MPYKPERTALARIPIDEPVFVLRARDVFAAELVEQWCAMASECKVDPAKVDAASECARAMRAWPDRRVPD